jgi:hypothetical protein
MFVPQRPVFLSESWVVVQEAAKVAKKGRVGEQCGGFFVVAIQFGDRPRSVGRKNFPRDCHGA